MIRVEATREDVWRCQSCNDKCYVTVSIGFEDRHTSSFKLCYRCTGKLSELLQLSVDTERMGLRVQRYTLTM